MLPPQDRVAPLEVKIQDHEPDSIQTSQAIYLNNQNRLVVNAENNFAGVDNTPSTPGDPNDNNAYMTLFVDGPDAGASLGMDPFILEGCDTTQFPPSPAVTCSIPMTFDPGTNLYEFMLDNVGVNLDGRRLVISTDEGGSDNIFIE